MRRALAHSALALAAALGMVPSGTAQADGPSTWMPHTCMARDFARNNHWPEPFIYQDRDAVVRPFGVMIAKGWQVQNTLSAYHFQPDNSRLADAGVHKLQQVLADPVAQRRMIFVQLGATPEQTMARVAAVRAAAAAILPSGGDVAIYPSGIQSRPWLAPEVLNVHASYDKSRGPVKLPAPKADQ